MSRELKRCSIVVAQFSLAVAILCSAVVVTNSHQAKAEDCPAPSKLVLKEVVPSKIVEREVVKEPAPSRIVEKEVTTDSTPTKTYVVEREVQPSRVIVEREVSPSYSTVVEREVTVDPTIEIRHRHHFRPFVEREVVHSGGRNRREREVSRHRTRR